MIRILRLAYLETGADVKDLRDKEIVVGDQPNASPRPYVHYRHEENQVFVAQFSGDTLIRNSRKSMKSDPVVQRGVISFDNNTFTTDQVEPGDERYDHDKKFLEELKIWQ
jgi:hypothetical protein